MGGRSASRMPGGMRRRGPAKPTGLARSPQCGSVRMLTPASCTSSVECPIHVTVGVVPLLRSVAPSLASTAGRAPRRSEEHTSELQSQFHLVCRLLLEKKKTKQERLYVYQITTKPERL